MRRMHIRIAAFAIVSAMTCAMTPAAVFADEKPTAEIAANFEDPADDTADTYNMSVTDSDYQSLAVSQLADDAVYGQLAYVTTETYVAVYQAPYAGSSLAGKLYNNNVAEILEETEGWYRIESGNLTGYVAAEELQTGDSAELVEAEKQGTASYGETTAEEAEREAAEIEETRQALVDYALQFVGNPYVYGGSSLTNGTDCSGFVMAVYSNFGITLPHSSYSQRSCGIEVSLNALEPGDIICYEGHVALYIGDGQIVHAANSSTGIVTGDMYYRTPICARRILH